MKNDLVISFLVINKNSNLSTLAINSVLKKTTAKIYVGYINKEDIHDLPKSDRIFYLLLDSNKVNYSQQHNQYFDFSTNEFYRIVQLKWYLLEELINLNYNYICYSDFDVVYLKNPIPDILETFETNSKVHILVQSFTTNPAHIRLCMGFVVIRNSDISRNFLNSAKKLHSNLYLENSFIGDDDVVTKLYHDMCQPEWIRELPQSTFPVGSLLNLFSKKNTYPGLGAPAPYIFHANYVIGLKNKRILLYLILHRFGEISSSLTYISVLILVVLKRIRLEAFSKIKSRWVRIS